MNRDFPEMIKANLQSNVGIMPKGLAELSLIVFAGLTFLLAALIVMSHGHLHEDAYILFQYAKKLSSGEGIVFDSTSGRMEGATDFLWMVTLSASSKITDIGSAAAILNAIGMMVIANVILKLRGQIDVLSITAIFAVIFSGGFAAAIGGFSTLAFGALYALLTWFVIQRKYLATTIMAILISLFRPDGVILAFGALLGFIILSQKNEWPKLVAMIGIIIITGFVYFIWRWNYFDVILPLPLIVKQKGDFPFAGLLENIQGVILYLLILIPLTVFRGSRNNQKILAISLGPALLFIALSFAHQSQNIGFRFQFPIILSLLFLLVVIIPLSKVRIYLIAATTILGILQGIVFIKLYTEYLTNDDYINNFPQLLKSSKFEANNIALTEAGRFPFWYDAKTMIDLVGLNSRGTVFNGAEYMLETQQPELIFVNQAGRYSLGKFDITQSYIITTPEDIPLNEYNGKHPVLMAPGIALKYARKHNFIAVLVKYGVEDTTFTHVYFLKQQLDINTFIKRLNKSMKQKSTYYSSI